MQANRLNANRVSKESMVAYTTLASFVQGDTQSLRGDTESKIASAYRATVAEIFERAPPADRRPRTVPLVGYVGAGAEAHYYEPADLGEVDAPDGATDKTVAAEIRGTSLGPLFESWLIFYDEVRTPVTPDLIGRLCIVGLPHGRVLVKKLRRAGDGLFHLESNIEPTIYDQEVTWAAQVKSMTPR